MPNELAAPVKAPAAAPGRAARPDPVQLERVRNALAAAVAEMTQALVRAAYSPDAMKDFSVGLFDAEARAIVQSQEAAPTSCADLAPVVRKGATLFEAEGFQPGDVVVSNDAEAGGHVSGVVVFSPMF